MNLEFDPAQKRYVSRKPKTVISLISTLIVVGILILSGPTRAVIVNVGTDKSTYGSSDSSVVFTVDVDVESDERIPVQNLTLKIRGDTDKTCIFLLNGTKVSGCGNLTISVINTAGHASGTLFGYGYGVGVDGIYNTTNMTFDTDYGYGYTGGYEYDGSTGGELRYNITWNLTAESPEDGDYTARLEAFAESGSYWRIYMDEVPTSFTIDTSTTPTTTTTPSSGTSSGSSGGGSVGPGIHKTSTLFTSVAPGVINIVKISDPEIGLKQIEITVKNSARNIKVTITKLDGKPASVTHEVNGKVYRYVEIDTDNLQKDNIDSAKVRFEVLKSWLDENEYDPLSVLLNRYTLLGWEELNTEMTGEDDDYYYYEAETPGFSTFAITGGKEPVTEVTTTTVKKTTTTVVGETTTVPIVDLTDKRGDRLIVWLVFIALLVAAVIVLQKVKWF